MSHEEFLDQPLEELLESIWVAAENGEELSGESLGAADAELLPRLRDSGFLEHTASLALTATGQERARLVVRRNRLAERLLADVLNVPLADAEHTACLLEHVLNRTVTNAVCTLLAHPPTCPHGRPIPRGACCEANDRTAQPVVRALPETEPGSRSRVAFLTPAGRDRLRKLESLGLVPGTLLTLRQKRPTLVVEIEGTTLALESEVGRDIFVRSE